MKQRGPQPSETVSRRRAMAAMVVAGAGLAAVAVHGTREVPPPSASRGPRPIRSWADVRHWTVRFPDRSSEITAMGHVPPLVDAREVLATLPAHDGMEWSEAGVCTDESAMEIVRTLRELIGRELLEGRVVMAGGWIVSQTEWNIMRLAASQGALASDAR
ncbi:MAG TPA: hypothetical protein VK176_04805 [Phycisphaerales bacterium]|nr:hypothetical protein [Phycisphaerales bacterium]